MGRVDFLGGLCYDGFMGRIPIENGSKSVERYGLSYIRPYHREIARRLVLGEMQSDIARDLRMSDSRMSIIVNSPLFKREIKRLEEARDSGTIDVTQTLRELSPVALEQVERTMYNRSGTRLGFDAACTILDRAGYGAINKQNINLTGQVAVKSSNMTDEELRSLVEERVKRMQENMDEERRALDEANSTEVKFDEVDEEECLGTERKGIIKLLEAG